MEVFSIAVYFLGFFYCGVLSTFSIKRGSYCTHFKDVYPWITQHARGLAIMTLLTRVSVLKNDVLVTSDNLVSIDDWDFCFNQIFTYASRTCGHTDNLIINKLWIYIYTCFDRGTRIIKSSNPCPAINTVMIYATNSSSFLNASSPANHVIPITRVNDIEAFNQCLWRHED